MIRRELRWSLGLSIAASVIALLWRPDEATSSAIDIARESPISAHARTVSHVSQTVAPPMDSPASAAPASRQPSPSASGVPIKSAVSFDPFAGVVAPPPPIATQPTQPAPPPTPPTPVYHFAGRLKNPAGMEQVFLTRGDAMVAVQAGTQLDDGYVVEAMTPDAVLLRYPALNTQARIPIAPLAESSGSP